MPAQSGSTGLMSGRLSLTIHQLAPVPCPFIHAEGMPMNVVSPPRTQSRAGPDRRRHRCAAVYRAERSSHRDRRRAGFAAGAGRGRHDMYNAESGSVSITHCSSSGRAPSTTCRSYMSGSVRKTSCS